jgi:hypothetical protein
MAWPLAFWIGNGPECWVTSELLDWIKLFASEDIDAETLRERDPSKLIPPLHGALLKNEQDVQLFERLAFLNRRKGQD